MESVKDKRSAAADDVIATTLSLPHTQSGGPLVPIQNKSNNEASRMQLLLDSFSASTLDFMDCEGAVLGNI